MKLSRVGEIGREIPAIIDGNQEPRDLSEYIKDFYSHNLNFKVLDTLQKICDGDGINKLKKINNPRFGPCINKPGKFIGI